MRDNENRLLTSLFAELTKEENLDGLRWSIVAVIRQELERRGDALAEWEAFHLDNAITMLATNVESLAQPTFAWLRLCLVDLRAALTPAGNQKAASLARGSAERAPGWRDLAGALAAVEKRIERRQGQVAMHGALLRRAHDPMPARQSRLNYN